ncbi:hypothetical protein GCM10023116_06880 [Kistimonas scapharcae]|uniref:Translocator protein BipB-like C-terminal domain-containing protein n=1 Tax=Kistimonas scapharcae TaxID=1036133 RepID=A0ABP8UZ31_9GAMM
MADGIRIDSTAASQSANNVPLDGTENAKEVVGRGFTDTNSVSHQGHRSVDGKVAERKIALPSPRLTAADTTPRILQEVDGSLKNINPYEALGELFTGLQDDLDEGEVATGTEEGEAVTGQKHAKSRIRRQNVLAEAVKQQIANPGKADLPAMGQLTQDDIAHFQSIEPKSVQTLSDTALDVMAHVGAIESAPKELMDDIKATATKAFNALLTGDVEDAARWLMEVQTKLQDNRIKFDSEAIQANKLRQQQTHENRMDKLFKQLEKLREAKKMGPIIQALSIIALLVTYVIAAATIITPGAQAAGALLFAAAAVMTASMVISETKVIKDEKAALAVSISLTVLAAILSLGAGLATTAGSGATTVASQAARTAAETTAKTAAKEAAKAALKEAAKGATDDVIKAAAREASKRVAERVARETAEAAITEGMKPMAKEILFRSTQKAAEQAAKKVTDSVIRESTKAATKATVRGMTQQQMQPTVNQITNTARNSLSNNAIKNIGQNAAQEATREAKMGAMYKIATYGRYSAQFVQGATMTAQGGVEIKSTIVKKEAADYGADAKEDMARLARLQFLMETLMENIREIYEQLTSGQQIASDTLKSALDTKGSIISHI